MSDSKEEKKENEQKIETKGDDSIIIPSQPEHSEYCPCDGDSSLCCDNEDNYTSTIPTVEIPSTIGSNEEVKTDLPPSFDRQPTDLQSILDAHIVAPLPSPPASPLPHHLRRRLEYSRDVPPLLVRQTNQPVQYSGSYSGSAWDPNTQRFLPLPDSDDDDFFDSDSDDEIQTQPDDSDEELERAHNEFVSQQHRRRRLLTEKRAQKAREKPEYYEYRGFKVDLNRLGRSPFLTPSKAQEYIKKDIDNIIKLKKEMLDANRAAEKDPNDKDKWIKVHIRANALKTALAKISYNLDAYGGRIFDGHNRQYEGGQDGWRTLMWNAREHLKSLYNPSYTMQPTTWLGGKTRRVRKRKTRKRKIRKRKSHKKKMKKKRKRKSRKKRKTRKKTRSK